MMQRASSSLIITKTRKAKKPNTKPRKSDEGEPDIIDTLQTKRIQWFDYVKRMPEEKSPKLIMEWIPRERRKRGRP